MDYIFNEQEPQTFEDEIRNLIENPNYEEIETEFEKQGHLFEKEDFISIVENNQDYILRRLKRTLDQRTQKQLKDYRKQLKQKGYSNKKIKQLIKKKKSVINKQ